MKKHELLKYAYDNYPKGTVAIHDGMIAEHVSTGSFKIIQDEYNGVCVLSDTGTECFYSENTNGEYWPTWAIPVKESILSGKCAIQVNNEREFKLLMEHYESKGWISQYIDINKYPYYIDYKDKFDSAYNKSPFESRGEKIIHFKDFAKEVEIEVPVFVMTSEDGVPLYIGDSIFEATLNTTPDSEDYNKWYLVNARGIGYWIANDNKNSRWISSPEKSKAFSAKEAAESWIKEQNKPKSIDIHSLHGQFTVTKNTVSFMPFNASLSFMELSGIFFDKIVEARKSLQS